MASRRMLAPLGVWLSWLLACSGASPAGSDAGPVLDGGAADGGDAGLDAGVASGADAGPDGGVDAGLDSGVDAGDAGGVSMVDAGPPLGLVTVGAVSGPTVPPDFAGLSIEIAFLGYGDFFGSPLKDGGVGSPIPQVVQLLRTLGPGAGTLRIGGSSVDQLCLEGFTDVACSSFFSLADVEQVFQTAQLAGWKVIFGINLGIDDPAYGVYAVEAGIVPAMSRFDAGALLWGIEIGNEPDLYPGHLYTVPLPDGGTATVRERDAGYGMAGIVGDSVAYATALAANDVTKPWPLTGPALNDASNLLRVSSYVRGIGAVDPGEPKFVTGHIYPTNDCPGNLADGGTWGTIPNLLSPAAHSRWTGFVADGIAGALDAGSRFEVSEGNSCACGGAPGVSNTLASALWGLDYLLSIAQLGALGVNFHGPGSAQLYAPIATSGTDAGPPQAQPLYYSMLAFDQTAAGRTFVGSTVDAGAYVTAYALTDPDAGSTTVIAINKSLDAGGALSIVVPQGGPTAALTVLTGPSLGAQGGVTWGGGGVDVAGNFSGAASLPVPFDPARGSYIVSLPTGTAAALSIPGQ